jgi:hypothetical protein
MKDKIFSRRTLLKSSGAAAAFLTGAGVFPGKTSRSLAVAPPLHHEDNVIAKSINSEPDRIPTLYGRLHNRQIAFVSAIFPDVPGLRLDACTYEPGQGFLRLDLLGMAVPEDNQIVLTHRVRKYPWLIHVTTLTAAKGSLEAVGRITVDKNAKVGDVKIPDSLPTPNMCWCFQKSPNFVAGGNANPPYGEQPKDYPHWIDRCFIFTENGQTFLDKTQRQKTDEMPSDDPRNNPVWTQHYVGVWQKINGETLPANTSRTRYVIPVIGATSNDGRYLVALASDSPRYIAQAWHTCLHHVVNWEPADKPILERHWRMKLYAMQNEPIVLMTHLAGDFAEAMKLKDHAIATP